MGNVNVQQRKFIVKAGMTTEDVKNSKEATALQKKYASAFDTDGVKGFSQKEADLFNATTFSEKADGSVTFWTRQKDGTKKGTKFNINDKNIQFKLDTEVNPYVKQVKKPVNQPKKDFDYSVDDGNISAIDKLKNLGKGIISPITSMFESKENFLVGAGIIAGSAALIVLTGGTAAPALITLGAGIGAVQLGVGIYKSNTATTDAEAEQAWQGIGAGTSAIALSALGAKSALKASGIDISEMNFLKATAICIKMTPEATVTSAKNLATTASNIVTNIGNIVPPGDGASPQLAVAGVGGQQFKIQYNGGSTGALNPAIMLNISVEDVATTTAAATATASAVMACTGIDANNEDIRYDEKGNPYKYSIEETEDGKLIEKYEYDDRIEIYDENEKLIDTKYKSKPIVQASDNPYIVKNVGPNKDVCARIIDNLLNNNQWKSLSEGKNGDKVMFQRALQRGKVVGKTSSETYVIKEEGEVGNVKIYELKIPNVKRVFGYRDPITKEFIFERLGLDRMVKPADCDNYIKNFKMNHPFLFR